MFCDICCKCSPNFPYTFYILMLLLTYRSCAKFIEFLLIVSSIAFRFQKSFITSEISKAFTDIFSSFWKLCMAVVCCSVLFFKVAEKNTVEVEVPSLLACFLPPIPSHRCSLRFWWFYCFHFIFFLHQLEFILLCGLRWNSNLRIFFPR